MGEKRYIDFADIKRRVRLEQVLEHYGIMSTLTGDGAQRKGPSPFEDRRDSTLRPFAVNLDKGVWSLFSKGGRVGGNVIDLVMRKEKCDVRQAAQKLAQWFRLDLAEQPSGITSTSAAGATVEIPEGLPNPSPLLAETDGKRCNKPLGFSLQGLDSNHETLSPLLRRWGIDRRIVASFGAGFYTGNGKTMKGRLAVPIYRRDARVGYCGIGLESGEELYRFPDKWVHGVELYNLTFARQAVDILLKRGEEIELLVFRHILQVWQATQLGYPASIAIMGNDLAPEQLALFREERLIDRVSVVLQLHITGSLI